MFNHVEFLIEYHSTETDEEEWNTGFLNEGGRIVRAKAILKSLNYDKVQNCNDVSNENPIFIPADFGTQESFNVKYTYSVKFVKNNEIKWASRWDYLLESKSDVKIQWFSILNSLVIVLFLSGMIATILFRAIRKDFAKYNGDNDEEVEEEIGWKSIHADVFRSPKNGLLLSVFVGNGVQIAIMSLITLRMYCLFIFSRKMFISIKNKTSDKNNNLFKHKNVAEIVFEIRLKKINCFEHKLRIKNFFALKVNYYF